MACLLRELRGHGVGHQRWGMLRSLCLGEWERGMTRASLCTTLTGNKLLGLEVGLASEGARLVVTKVGLSITIVAASAEAIAATVVTAPIASVL